MLERLKSLQEVSWRNVEKKPFEEAVRHCPLKMEDILDAAQRLDRFAPFFMQAFPETKDKGGRVESELREIPRMKECLEADQHCSISGRLYLKMDSHLPVSGSIKARGGVYEVLKCAEDIALREGLITKEDDYSAFAHSALREKFSEYSIAVGSTGNLGLSIGIISAALGFRVTVHMSADARQWKKDLLRSKGVEVVEYQSDYSEAVRQGRLLAQKDPKCHFVDDENSQTLFLGYAVSALRLKTQLEALGVPVDAQHPLMVYLPCGVGGGPGGVAFGLKQVFGDSAHCFFAEPVKACCMLLGMYTGKHQDISVADLGIQMNTVADGLAVGRASGFVGRLMEPFMSGCYTLQDERMFRMLAQLSETEGIRLEPSALAGMYGPVCVEKDPAFVQYRGKPCATHLVWATGGSMVPEEEMLRYIRRGKELLENKEACL